MVIFDGRCVGIRCRNEGKGYKGMTVRGRDVYGCDFEGKGVDVRYLIGEIVRGF